MVGGIRRVLLDSMRRWKRESEAATLGNATCGVCVHAMHVVCTMHSEANAAFQTQEHNSKNIVHNAHCTVKPMQHSCIDMLLEMTMLLEEHSSSSIVITAIAHVQSCDFFGGSKCRQSRNICTWKLRATMNIVPLTSRIGRSKIAQFKSRG